jgi:hypothetical protein
MPKFRLCRVVSTGPSILTQTRTPMLVPLPWSLHRLHDELRFPAIAKVGPFLPSTGIQPDRHSQPGR